MEQTVKNLQEKCDKLYEFMAAQHEKNRALFDKIDGLSKSNDLLVELVSDMKVIASNLAIQGRAVEKLSEDVEDLKKIPSRRMDQIFYIVVSAAVGIIVGLITARFALGGGL